MEFDEMEIEKNLVRSADKQIAKKMEQVILQAKEDGDSVGGIVEIKIENIKEKIGDPIFGKLKAKLADALLSIGGIFSFEIIPALGITEQYGSQANKIDLGISGGIATGYPIVIRCAVRPTPSISKSQKMKTQDKKNVIKAIVGRHDPCIIPRLIPVAEAMCNLVVADLLLENKKSKI